MIYERLHFCLFRSPSFFSPPSFSSLSLHRIGHPREGQTAGQALGIWTLASRRVLFSRHFLFIFRFIFFSVFFPNLWTLRTLDPIFTVPLPNTKKLRGALRRPPPKAPFSLLNRPPLMVPASPVSVFYSWPSSEVEFCCIELLHAFYWWISFGFLLGFLLLELDWLAIFEGREFDF